jgi:hypothetical protein
MGVFRFPFLLICFPLGGVEADSIGHRCCRSNVNFNILPMILKFNLDAVTGGE